VDVGAWFLTAERPGRGESHLRSLPPKTQEDFLQSVGVNQVLFTQDAHRPGQRCWKIAPKI
jgi:hypothetical protein